MERLRPTWLLNQTLSKQVFSFSFWCEVVYEKKHTHHFYIYFVCYHTYRKLQKQIVKWDDVFSLTVFETGQTFIL
jgi:hypothetical protein